MTHSKTFGPVIINISDERTGQEWESMLQRFKRSFNDEEKSQLMGELTSLPILATTFGNGTPGRALLDELNHLIANFPSLAKLSRQVRSELVIKYAKYRRCLACDRTFTGLGVFFFHLEGHSKNLTGTRRKYEDYQREQMGQIQAKLLSIEARKGGFGQPHPSWPRYVVGKVYPSGMANGSSVCLDRRDVYTSQVISNPACDQKMEENPRKKMRTGDLQNSSTGLTIGKMSEVKVEPTGESDMSMGTQQARFTEFLGQPPLLHAGEAHVKNGTSITRPGISKHLTITQSPSLVNRLEVNAQSLGRTSVKQSPTPANRMTFLERVRSSDSTGSPGQSPAGLFGSNSLKPAGGSVKRDYQKVISSGQLKKVINDSNETPINISMIPVKESAPAIKSRETIAKVAAQTIEPTPKFSISIVSGKGQGQTAAPPNKSFALDDTSGNFLKKIEGKTRGEIRFYGTVTEIKDVKNSFDIISKERSLKTGVEQTKLDTLQYLFNLHYRQDSSDLKNNDSVPPFQSTPNDSQQPSSVPSKKPRIIKSPGFNKKAKTDREHFLANWKCLDHYGRALNEHGKICPGKMVVLRKAGVVGFTCKQRTYKCSLCGLRYQLFPSPRLHGRGASDFMAGLALRCSGGMESTLERWCEHVGMKLPNGAHFQNGKFKKKLVHKIVGQQADRVREASLQKALEKVGGNKIRLTMDAAHNTRRNSRNSTLTAQDPDTNKIVMTENIHYSEEPSSQKHEGLGGEKMAEKMSARGIEPDVVCADGGSKASPAIKRKFEETIQQDEDWHDLNKLDPYFKEALKNIRACDDKIVLIRKHVYTCLANCKITPEEYRIPEKLEAATSKFRGLLLQAANHFQGVSGGGEDAVFHEGCLDTSPCKEKNYGLNAAALSSKDAKKLRTAIAGTKFYKRPERYILHMNTSAVESCHRVQNIYRDKGTTYTEAEYDCRIDLSVLHWNEQVGERYEDGKLKEGVQFTKGPAGNVKKERATRNFINDINDAYFNEIVNSDDEEGEDVNDTKTNCSERQDVDQAETHGSAHFNVQSEQLVTNEQLVTTEWVSVNRSSPENGSQLQSHIAPYRFQVNIVEDKNGPRPQLVWPNQGQHIPLHQGLVVRGQRSYQVPDVMLGRQHQQTIKLVQGKLEPAASKSGDC